MNRVQPLPGPRRRARRRYDDTSGQHAYDVAKDSVTIGRGGIAYPVDIRIASSADVSREHARIRRDPQTGRFYLIDLSSLGTTLNGRHVPRGYDEVDGTKRENGVETSLPDTARIGLADTVFLDFEGAGLMTLLLLARFVFLVVLAAVVAGRCGCRPERAMTRHADASRRSTAAGATDPGLQREVNEDRFHVDVARGLFIVVDGVGGQAAGGKAADVALAMLRERLERETGPVAERVREAITVANNEIHRLAATGLNGTAWRACSPSRSSRTRRRDDRPRRRHAAVQAPRRRHREDHARSFAGRRARGRATRSRSSRRCGIRGATRSIATWARSRTSRTIPNSSTLHEIRSSPTRRCCCAATA